MAVNYGALANKERRAVEVSAIKNKARSEISALSQNEFFLVGLVLYWAEGSKKILVDLANSDPKIVAFMMKWFREACRVEDQAFRVQLHLHDGQDEASMKLYWANLMKLPLTQFHKSFIKKEGTGHRKNKLYCGTVKIRICNRNLLHQILGWIEGLSQVEWAVSSVGRADDSSIKGPASRKAG